MYIDDTPITLALNINTGTLGDIPSGGGITVHRIGNINNLPAGTLYVNSWTIYDRLL